MRIGFDAKRAFLNKAGLGNYSRNTLAGLNKYFPEHQYVLFSPEAPTRLFKEHLFFETVTPSSRIKKLFSAYWRSFQLSDEIDRQGLDLFHGLSNELPAGIHKSAVPAVVTIHDLIFLSLPGLYSAIDRRIYYRKVKYACQAARRIIATSRQTRNDLIYHLEIEEEKIDVIYQSISERFFLNHYVEEVNPVLKRYRLPREFILTVGTIEERKNQLGVLQALHRTGLGLPYVIVGKPTLYTEQIIHYAEKYQLLDRLHILTNVPDYDLPALYQQATCMLYLSHYEGFGLPIIEAMACGCPVITSSVSSLPEIGGEAALYCNPNDQEAVETMILKVVENQALSRDMSQKGKKRARVFHPEGRTEALMSFYQKVAGNG